VRTTAVILAGETWKPLSVYTHVNPGHFGGKRGKYVRVNQGHFGGKTMVIVVRIRACEPGSSWRESVGAAMQMH